MSISIIQQKLLDYQCKTILEQENALKEIAQEIALLALSRTNFLKNAISQNSSWAKKNIDVTPTWFYKELTKKIKNIDWNDAKKDVERFLRDPEQSTLELWNKDFFLSRLDKLSSYL